jgi:hypothetical protein
MTSCQIIGKRPAPHQAAAVIGGPLPHLVCQSGEGGGETVGRGWEMKGDMDSRQCRIPKNITETSGCSYFLIFKKSPKRTLKGQ